MNGNCYDYQELFNENFFKKVNFINETKIFNELQNSKKILIFDFRPKAEFLYKHFENSLNLPIDEIDVDCLMKFDENELKKYTDDNYIKSLVSKYKRLFIGFICSSEKIKRKSFLSPDLSKNENLQIGKILTFYKTLISNKIREIGLYIKGFNKIENSFNYILVKNLVPFPKLN